MDIIKTTLKCKDAKIEIEKLTSGKNRITVTLLDKTLFMPYGICETTYPVNLIEQILSVKGPGWLCDEIMRDESINYAQDNLRYDVLSYVSEDEFKNKCILDFGCGSGASTMTLCRMLPFTKIVGIEIDDKLLSIARSRARHHGFDKRSFIFIRNILLLSSKLLKALIGSNFLPRLSIAIKKLPFD